MWNTFEYFYQLAGRQLAMGAQQFMLMSTVEAAYVSMCDWVGFSVYVCSVCVCVVVHTLIAWPVTSSLSFHGVQYESCALVLRMKTFRQACGKCSGRNDNESAHKLCSTLFGVLWGHKAEKRKTNPQQHIDNSDNGNKNLNECAFMSLLLIIKSAFLSLLFFARMRCDFICHLPLYLSRFSICFSHHHFAYALWMQIVLQHLCTCPWHMIPSFGRPTDLTYQVFPSPCSLKL